MKSPRYEDFRFRGTINPSIIKETIDGREVFYAPTGAEGNAGEQYLAVYQTVPQEMIAPEPIVRMPAWSDDNGRPECAVFDALLAGATGRPVLAPNAPGVDFSQWRDSDFDDSHLMTPDQIEELEKHGSFTKAGAAVLRATSAAARHFEMPPDLILHSSSMGVALAGGAIRAALASGTRLNGIVLAEGVNYTARSTVGLAVQFAGQNKYAGGYLQQNPDLLKERSESMVRWGRRTLEAWPANWRYIQGLGRGAFVDDIGDISGLARNEQDTPVFMSRGTLSKLAAPEGHDAVRELFERHDVTVGSREYGGHDHPYTMTVQSVIDGVREVA